MPLLTYTTGAQFNMCDTTTHTYTLDKDMMAAGYLYVWLQDKNYMNINEIKRSGWYVDGCFSMHKQELYLKC